MEREILKRYEGNGQRKHLVFRCGPEIRTRNGIVVLVTEETLIFKTLREEEVAIPLQDVLRVEDYRENPDGGDE